MKKIFKAGFSVVVFSALTVGELPSMANCQMLFGSRFSPACTSPCCETKMPMPHCPILKSSAPRDTIAGSQLVFDNVLQPLHALKRVTLSVRPLITHRLSSIVQTVEQLFSAPTPAVRAPPASVFLQAA